MDTTRSTSRIGFVYPVVVSLFTQQFRKLISLIKRNNPPVAYAGGLFFGSYEMKKLSTYKSTIGHDSLSSGADAKKFR